MDILDRVFLVVHCEGCKGTYEVSARVARSAETMLHEGCPVQNVRNCPELYYASLVDPDALDELARAWAHVEATARSHGSNVLLRPESESVPRAEGGRPSIGLNPDSK